MKKNIAIVTVASLIIGLTSGVSWAGSARRHTIEGILLGTGAVILGTAIVTGMNNPDKVVVHHHGSGHGDKESCRKKRQRGYWEVRKVWVPAEYETRWNPGHYNKHGRWVQGRYEEFRSAGGHWEEQRVWVRSRHRI